MSYNYNYTLFTFVKTHAGKSDATVLKLGDVPLS
jgi:hypothetical protein